MKMAEGALQNSLVAAPGSPASLEARQRSPIRYRRKCPHPRCPL